VIAPGGLIPFDQAHNARSDVKARACAQISGEWVLKGTVVNVDAKARSFQIVVDFVTQPGSTVLSSTVVNVPSVGPGATAQWSAAGARGKANVACIVRQAQAS
jgi:hypothetical protein